MTRWQNRADELTLRMAQDLKLRNYSQKSIDACRPVEKKQAGPRSEATTFRHW